MLGYGHLEQLLDLATRSGLTEHGVTICGASWWLQVGERARCFIAVPIEAAATVVSSDIGEVYTRKFNGEIIEAGVKVLLKDFSSCHLCQPSYPVFSGAKDAFQFVERAMAAWQLRWLVPEATRFQRVLDPNGLTGMEWTGALVDYALGNDNGDVITTLAVAPVETGGPTSWGGDGFVYFRTHRIT